MRQIVCAAGATLVLGLPAAALEAPRKVVDHDIQEKRRPAPPLYGG